MANVTARFGADFSKFTTAVAGASTTLSDFEGDAKKVQTAITRIGDAFGGKKLIQDAEMTAKAIDGIGGASKLTAAEQAKVNALVTEAIAKYAALGKTAPQALTDLAAATTKVQTATDAATKSSSNWKTQLTGLAGAVGIGFSVGAVVSFGKAVFDAGGQINDMADKIGISTDAVQGFKFAAEQSGSSLDAVGTSITKLNLNLATGDKSTVSALNDLGLKFGDIATMKPEDAFLAITDALKGVADQGEQTRIGTALMGKGFAELTPAIKAGFRDVSDSAAKMSAQTIADLDAAGDAWADLYNHVVIYTGGMISEIMRFPATVKSAMSSATGSLAGFQVFLSNAFKLGIGPAIAMSGAIQQAADAAANLPPAVAPIPPIIKKTKDELDAAAAAAKKYADELAKFSGAAATADLKVLDRVLRDLTASGKLTATAVALLSKEAMGLFAAGGTLTPALQQLVITTGDFGPGLEKAGAELKGIGEYIAITIPKLSEFDQALIKLGTTTAGLPGAPVKQAFSFDIDIAATGAAIVKANEVAAANARKAWEAELSRVQSALGSLASAFAASTSATMQNIGQMLGGLNAVGDSLRAAGAITTQAGKAGTGGILTPLFDADASAADKWAAGMTGAMTVASGAVNVWRIASDAATKSTAAFGAAMAGAQAGAAFGPWGAAIGAAAGALTGFIRSLTAGRRAVEDFAASFDTAARGSGFDELHSKLLELGAAGEQLWIKLTQQTGRGDVAGAKAVEAEIDAVLARTPSALAAAAGYQTSAELQRVADDAKRVYDFMLASGQYSASELARAFQASAAAQSAALGESSQAQQDALDAITAKYADTISKLDSEIKSLSDSIAREAPEEFMGVVEAQERARRADLENQRAAQTLERDAELAAKQATFNAMLAAGQDVDSQLRTLFGKPLVIPYSFAPSGSSPTGAPLPTLTDPTLPSSVPVAPPAGRGGGGTAVLQLDGRTLAEVVVPAIPGVVTRYGLAR